VGKEESEGGGSGAKGLAGGKQPVVEGGEEIKQNTRGEGGGDAQTTRGKGLRN